MSGVQPACPCTGLGTGMGRKKSPIRKQPLREPGETLRDQLHDVVYGRILLLGIIGILALAAAVGEWLRWWLRTPPQPLIVSALAVLAIVVVAWRIARILPKARQIGLGYRGEQTVGHMLEQLRADGYHVFHDIPGNGFNVDHVIVGPGGVFVIETKARMKPLGDTKVIYDGDKVKVDGLAPDRDPIVQVQAAARQVRELIKQTAGLDAPIRPVVLFPGWFTRQPPRSEIWVLNETAFPKWVRGAKPVLDVGSVSAVAAGLETHLRNA